MSRQPAAAPAEPLDLRLAGPAVAAWASAALGTGLGIGWSVGGLFLLLGLGGLCLRSWRIAGRHRRPLAIALTLIVGGAALGAAALRVGSVQSGPLQGLASTGASVALSGVVTADPVVEHGTFGPYTLVQLIAHEVTAHGEVTEIRSPVLLIGDSQWAGVRYGAMVAAIGHLREPDSPDLAAVLIAAGPPEDRAAPAMPLRIIGRVRAGLSEAAKPLPPVPRALLPALVDGDVSTMPAEATTDFRSTGLTHLLAVSGSNLTLVLGFALFVAGYLRVTGYGRTVVGAATVVLFVLLARPEPSVLRAAAMGVVALAGLASGSRARGIRTLCVAVIGLVLVDPWLARSAGFALSTLATGAILLLGPPWRALLGRWLPVPIAEALAVPLAAQLACTPVVAALSGQVSLVAVLANVAVGPAVGPATVLSLLAGLVATAQAAVGQAVARLAGLPLGWICWVAEHGAALHGAAMPWDPGAVGLVMLTLACAAAIGLVPYLLRSRLAMALAAAMTCLVFVHPIGRPGWPPRGWVMVMCDVGQGDGMVLNAGSGAALVVDTGPDPAAMGSCLRSLGVSRIPLVVLTHDHADHVDGLSAVVGGWPVSAIEVSPYDEPADRYHDVMALARQNRIPVSTPDVGEQQRVGQLRWQVLGPPEATAHGVGDGGSGPNNASIVMLLQVSGIAILLAGDAETEEQDAILAAHPDLRVDVLKEPHHGSGVLDPRFVAATQAAVSLISVGAGNSYGHPAPRALAILRRDGIAVYRTDQDGAIALTVRDGTLGVETER